MEGFYIVLAVLGAIAVQILMIWLWYRVAKEFYLIACKKGYDEKKYLWWTFFFGIAGMLMVVALPTRASNMNPDNAPLPTSPVTDQPSPTAPRPTTQAAPRPAPSPVKISRAESESKSLQALLKKTSFFSSESEMIHYLRQNSKNLSGPDRAELDALLNLPEGKLRDEIKKRIGG